MRKYQQLALLLISCFSIGVLLMYKSENNRLKYVLRVVNFFGRSDAAVLQRLDNSNLKEDEELPDFTHPLPVWQAIGESFHAYASYWNRNELVAGGEALAIVAGKRGAVVNFRCSVQYEDGLRVVQGKFRFQRVDNEYEDANSPFTSYRFFCRLTRDFGLPEAVTFTDATAATATTHRLKLRYLKPLSGENTVGTPQLVTICLNLANFNSSSRGDLLQFFLHHQILGIEHYLVYNGDEIPRHILKQLRRHANVHLHLLPFNFPFDRSNDTERLRHIIESDCLMRNTNFARHTLLLEPNEFFYPNAKLTDNRSVLRSLQHYAADVTRFELPMFDVCIDHSHKLLVDNTLYDPEVRPPHRLFLYRPHVPVTTALAADSSRSVSLQLSMALAHRYIKCLHVGKDGLHDWRNSLREDFMQNIQAIRSEMEVLV